MTVDPVPLTVPSRSKGGAACRGHRAVIDDGGIDVQRAALRDDFSGGIVQYRQIAVAGADLTGAGDGVAVVLQRFAGHACLDRRAVERYRAASVERQREIRTGKCKSSSERDRAGIIDMAVAVRTAAERRDAVERQCITGVDVEIAPTAAAAGDGPAIDRSAVQREDGVASGRAGENDGAGIIDGGVVDGAGAGCDDFAAAAVDKVPPLMVAFDSRTSETPAAVIVPVLVTLLSISRVLLLMTVGPPGIITGILPASPFFLCLSPAYAVVGGSQNNRASAVTGQRDGARDD